MPGSFDDACNTASNGTTFVGVFQILMQCGAIFVHHNKLWQDLRLMLSEVYTPIPLWWTGQQMTANERTEIHIYCIHSYRHACSNRCINLLSDVVLMSWTSFLRWAIMREFCIQCQKYRWHRKTNLLDQSYPICTAVLSIFHDISSNILDVFPQKLAEIRLSMTQHHLPCFLFKHTTA